MSDGGNVSRMKYRWRSSISLGFIAAALLTLHAGCSHTTSASRVSILEAEAKMLMTAEAQQGFRELFQTTFDPAKTRVLAGAELQKWFQDHRVSVERLAEQIKASIKNNQAAGLLIEGGLPGKNGGKNDVVYLRPPPLGFGFRHLFLNADPDPCGDGNPAMCERCTGCSGESEPGGTIHTCVCTMSCDSCVPCPNC